MVVMNNVYGPTICTASGKYFHFVEFERNEVDIEDIAASLSKINRFNGHTRLPYSVAQHSVLVSHIVTPRNALWGLLHDAHEAYIGDMPSPLKMLLPDFRNLEARVASFVRARLGLVGIEPDQVRQADLVALANEQHYLTAAKDHDWIVTRGIPHAQPIEPWPHDIARNEFLHRYKQLTT